MRPFAKLPNAVARDPQLLPEGLVILAYRATFIGAFSLHEKAVCCRPATTPARPGICRGLSRDVFRRACANCQSLGYLERRQPRQRLPDGGFKYGRVVEGLWF